MQIGGSALLLLLVAGSFIMLYRNLLAQQRLAEIKNDFISNITHELKTPIATVGVAIEALKNFNAINNPERTREYLDISSVELQRLSLLVDKVLKLSMFEQNAMEFAREPVNLKGLVVDVMDSMRLQLEKSGAAIHLDAADRALMASTGTAAAASPTSNLFLGSGFFDFAAARAAGVRHGLASDVGGGTSFSPFHTMLAAYNVAREGHTKPGESLLPSHLWWLHTAGAARALGLQDTVGQLMPGQEADFVVLDPQATPLLARRTAQADSLEELLFALIVLGDERLVERVVTA